MAEQKTDVEIVQEFLGCNPERAQDLIDRGINVDFIRSRGKGLYDKKIKEAQQGFLSKISKIKDNLNREG